MEIIKGDIHEEILKLAEEGKHTYINNKYEIQADKFANKNFKPWKLLFADL